MATPAEAQTWAACGVRDADSKRVRTFNREPYEPGGNSIGRLLCGEQVEDGPQWGYRHIKAKHTNDWAYMAAWVGSADWRSMADWAIARALADPVSSFTYDSRRDVYVYVARADLRKKDGPTILSRWPLVVVARRNNRIITAYPRGSSPTALSTAVRAQRTQVSQTWNEEPTLEQISQELDSLGDLDWSGGEASSDAEEVQPESPTTESVPEGATGRP